MNSEILIGSEFVNVLNTQFIAGSSTVLAIGFAMLLIVIRAIDSAARHIPLPEFAVFFAEHEEVKMKRNEVRAIGVFIHNKGEDFAESVESFIIFPPKFKVMPQKGYELVKQTSDTDYPNWTAVIAKFDLIHIDVQYPIGITLTAPDEKKKYEIHIDICERKIGESKHKLTIEVTN